MVLKSWFTSFSFLPVFSRSSCPYSSYCNILISHLYLLHALLSIISPTPWHRSVPLYSPSVFLSRLILRHRETQISPLSTHSRLVEVQLMKLTLNLSNLSLDVTFLKPRHRFTVYYVSQFLAQGDLPQVLGSEGVTVVVKHDCCIDCTQHRNSW